MHENTIMLEIAKSYPSASSIKKLVTATGKARNEIVENLESLKLIGYISLTNKNEVYLLADGRKYLGVENTTPIHSLPVDDKQKASDVKDADTALKASQNNVTSIGRSKTKLLDQIKLLGEKLKQPDFNIHLTDAELKIAALRKLAPLLSDDLQELLEDIANDIEAVSQVFIVPDDAA